MRGGLPRSPSCVRMRLTILPTSTSTTYYQTAVTAFADEADAKGGAMSEMVKRSEATTVELLTLAELINAEHRACEAAATRAIEHAIRCGALLIEAKQSKKHGGWMDWIAQNFEGSQDLANKYMKVARNSERVMNLARSGRSISLRGALEEIKTAKEEGRAARLRRAESMERVSRLLFPGDVEIRHCDFRGLALAESSVDLIFTDPPYPEEYLPLWEDLSRLAATALKPGAVLVSYTGHYHLPKVMEHLAKHLEYVWLGTVVQPGPMTQFPALAVQSGRSRPLLFYKQRGDTSVNLKWCRDTIESPRPDKEHHHWGQTIGAPRYYIKQLTEPGALVVDPFLGGGTTAVAAQELGRSFIGCDVDWSSVVAAKDRLAA